MKKFLPLLAIVILLIGIPAGIYLTKKTQDNRGQAAVSGGTAQFFLSAPTAIDVGTIAPVTVSLQTPATPANKGITIIKATLTYTFSGTNPLSVASDQIQFKLASPWSLLKKDVITDANSATIVLEAAYLQAGETGDVSMTSQVTPVATLNMTAAVPGTIAISFDPARSYVKSKDRNLDILGLNSQTASMTIGGASTDSADQNEEGGLAAEDDENDWINDYDDSAEWSDEVSDEIEEDSEDASAAAEASSSGRKAIAVKVTNLLANQTLTNTLPVLRGKATPFAQIHILIQSDPIEGDTTADANGNWTWTPEEPLPGGDHTLTVTATDQLGSETSTKVAFSITDEAGATQLADAGTVNTTLLILFVGLSLVSLGIVARFKRL